jgi:hypothetical protein
MTKITQLPVATTITDTGVFVIVDQGTTRQLPWQVFRQGGLRGATGLTGATGTTGLTGPMGTIATIAVGYVTEGDTALVEMSTATHTFIAVSTITSATYVSTVSSISIFNSTGVVPGSVFSIANLTTTSNLTVTAVNGNVITFSPGVRINTSTSIGSSISFTNTGTPGTYYIDYRLPRGLKGDTGTFVPVIASSSTIGGVKIGTGVAIAGDGTISVTTASEYVLPTASTSTLGGIKIGEGITIDAGGVISATTATQYQLSTATDVVLGGVKIGAGIAITDGVISVTTGAFALQTATNVIIGGVKIGSGIDITSSGTISVSTGVSVASSLTGTRLASNVTASSLTSVGTLTEITIAGLTSLQQTIEVYNIISTASGVVIHNCSASSIFVHNAPAANWTANFTNVVATANRVMSVAVLINQGATPRVPTAIQINGAPQTINWESGVVPTGNANKVDLVNFTFFISDVAVYQVLGNLASFG